jgi:hypothetical protein
MLFLDEWLVIKWLFNCIHAILPPVQRFIPGEGQLKLKRLP